MFHKITIPMQRNPWNLPGVTSGLMDSVQAAGALVGDDASLVFQNPSVGRQQVTPATALQHVQQFPGHKVGSWGSTRSSGPVWVWDMPFPFALHCPPLRCHTCKRLGAKAPETCQYFPVTPADIATAWPHLLRHKFAKQKEHWFTPRFVLEACMIFYETLNARQVRRQLCSIWSASALAAATRLERQGVAPWSLAAQCASMPKSPVAWQTCWFAKTIVASYHSLYEQMPRNF